MILSRIQRLILSDAKEYRKELRQVLADETLETQLLDPTCVDALRKFAASTSEKLAWAVDLHQEVRFIMAACSVDLVCAPSILL